MSYQYQCCYYNDHNGQRPDETCRALTHLPDNCVDTEDIKACLIRAGWSWVQDEPSDCYCPRHYGALVTLKSEPVWLT